jgi:hypothetical protein
LKARLIWQELGKNLDARSYAAGIGRSSTSDSPSAGARQARRDNLANRGMEKLNVREQMTRI